MKIFLYVLIHGFYYFLLMLSLRKKIIFYKKTLSYNILRNSFISIKFSFFRDGCAGKSLVCYLSAEILRNGNIAAIYFLLLLFFFWFYASTTLYRSRFCQLHCGLVDVFRTLISLYFPHAAINMAVCRFTDLNIASFFVFYKKLHRNKLSILVLPCKWVCFVCVRHLITVFLHPSAG